MKNRSRTDIIADILEGAVGGITKTKIMYKAFLSYEQLKEYLQILTESGLLEYDKMANIFLTTAKGSRFLKLYEELNQEMQTNLR